MAGNRQRFDPNVNYYEILDVSYSATRDEITRAYRHLMRYAHPDNFSGEQDRRKAEERAKLLNAAYAVLGKPEIRREYDQVFKKQAISDAVFQQYTGNVPGRHAPHRAQRPPMNPTLRRKQRRANRSAFVQLMLFTAFFALVVIVVIVVASLIGQGIGWLV